MLIYEKYYKVGKLCANSLFAVVFLCVSVLSLITNAADKALPEDSGLRQDLESCYLEEIEKADSSMTIAQIIDFCQEKVKQQRAQRESLSPLQIRLLNEWKARNNPSVFTTHKRNYLLPVTYSKNPNDEIVQDSFGDAGLDRLEAKFQLSFKVPILYSLIGKDALFFGFTMQSYWQVYNSELSAPFRETNYQPEIFYAFTNDFKLGGWLNRVNLVGFEHQSNGRSQPLSRSWNRIYLQTAWEKGQWLLSFRPWYRLPEDERLDPSQADGDDNPDISKFMGYFEFTANYKFAEQNFGLLLRNNLRSSNRGALQLDWTFPMSSRFKGYVQYFRGYGESLIDYDASIERVGLGVVISDIF